MKVNHVLIIFSLILALITPDMFSQVRLSVQPGLQLPIGDFSSTASVGFGGNLTAEFITSQKKGVDWSITGMAGYNYFSANEEVPDSNQFTYGDVPITAGIRYYLARSDFKPYIGAELGFHLLTIKYQGRTASDSYFGFAPIVGFKSFFTDELELDINVKLNSISSEGSSLSFIGFNFGVQFPVN